MAVRDIIRADERTLGGARDSVLRAEFAPVSEIDDRVRDTVTDLRDTLHSDTLSVGLAAPQIGFRAAIIVVNLNKEVDDDLVLINPKIVSESGQKDTKYESCMSIPHKRGKVTRRKKVTVTYMDVGGVTRSLSASGFLARVLMHEIDHLNGILYSDRLDGDSELEDTDLFREHGVY